MTFKVITAYILPNTSAFFSLFFREINGVVVFILDFLAFEIRDDFAERPRMDSPRVRKNKVNSTAKLDD